MLRLALIIGIALLASADDQEKDDESLLKRLVSRIPTTNLSKLAGKVSDSLREAVNKLPKNNSLMKLADKVDGGVKKVVETIKSSESSDALHALGERVKSGWKTITTLLPSPRKDDDDDKKKPFALDINIPHIFSLKLGTRDSKSGGRLAISVLRPLLDLSIRRKKKTEEDKEKKDDIKKKEDVKKDN